MTHLITRANWQNDSPAKVDGWFNVYAAENKKSGIDVFPTSNSILIKKRWFLPGILGYFSFKEYNGGSINQNEYAITQEAIVDMFRVYPNLKQIVCFMPNSSTVDYIFIELSDDVDPGSGGDGVKVKIPAGTP